MIITGSNNGDRFVIKDLDATLSGDQKYVVENTTQGYTFTVVSTLNDREKEIIRKGGLLPYTRARSGM